MKKTVAEPMALYGMGNLAWNMRQECEKIEELYLAAIESSGKGSFRETVMVSLFELYMKEKRTSDARRIGKRLLAAYPTSSFKEFILDTLAGKRPGEEDQL